MVRRLAALFLLALCAAPLAKAAPKAVKEEHRACVADADCEVVNFHCLCMYCARPNDVKNGVADAVNRAHVKTYAAPCSAEDHKGCATAGPCAASHTAQAKCVAKKCALVIEPRK
jgi:hypothetical protein